MEGEKKDKDWVEVQEENQRIRMTLRGREVKPLEAACSEIVLRAKHQGYKTHGPVRIPTKTLTVTTRRSPCGNGTNTWDRYEMRIHKRVIDTSARPMLSVRSPTSELTQASMSTSLSGPSDPSRLSPPMMLSCAGTTRSPLTKRATPSSSTGPTTPRPEDSKTKSSILNHSSFKILRTHA